MNFASFTDRQLKVLSDALIKLDQSVSDREADALFSALVKEQQRRLILKKAG